MDYKVGNDGTVSRCGAKVAEHTNSYAGDRKIYLNKNAREILSLIKKRSLVYGFYDSDFIFVNSKSSRLNSTSINGLLY